jgi:two-component system invasion response regulator UvrY
MAERSKAAVLKTVESIGLRGFESLSLRHDLIGVSNLIKVLLVDDHELVRIGIRRLLQDINGIKVVGEAKTGEEAVRLAKEFIPDVVLMDVQMPGIGGLEATRKMSRHNPDVKIIALTVFGEEPYPSRLLQAGAAGYITKGCDADEMVRAIRSVYSGQRYISAEIAQQLALKRFTKPEDSPLDVLSERELQITLMITSGQKVQDISEKLCLSPKTVNSYRYRIFEKLGINSDVELTLLALRLGLVEGHKSQTEES